MTFNLGVNGFFYKKKIEHVFINVYEHIRVFMKLNILHFIN